MPSQRPQLNVRLSPEEEARLDTLVSHFRAEGNSAITRSDVIRIALTAAWRLYEDRERRKRKDT